MSEDYAYAPKTLKYDYDRTSAPVVRGHAAMLFLLVGPSARRKSSRQDESRGAVARIIQWWDDVSRPHF